MSWADRAERDGYGWVRGRERLVRRVQLRASAWLLATAAVAGIVIVVVAVLLGGVAAQAERRQQDVAARVQALVEAQLLVEKLLLDVETGQRGFLLTGRAEFLEPYDDARARLPAALDEVDRLSTSTGEQDQAARQLRTLTRAKLKSAADAIEVHGYAGPDAARAVVASGRGRRIMDQLRAVIQESAAAGNLERQARSAEAQVIARRATLVGISAAVALVTLLGLTLWLVRQRELAERRRHDDERVREVLRAELAHQAAHDALTGQPNRRLLEDRLTQALARCARDGTLLAVLFIDLDRFKQVNDRHGHTVGDRVLVHTAERLRSMLRSTDTLARIGGDEFVIVCEQLNDVSAAMRLVESVHEQVSYALEVDGIGIDVTASIGVVVADHLGMRLDEVDPRRPASGPPDTESLLAAADEAMYHAKSLGRARHSRYTTEVARNRRDRVTLAGDLRAALDGDEAVGGRLWVAFQPLVELDTGRAVGVEALCRWSHPEHGEIGPGTFIPVAESSGLITTLGDLVLHTAITQLSQWNSDRAQQGLPPLYASVNCSARQLLHPGYTDRLAQMLHQTGTDPRNLVIELTESVLVDTVTGAAARLQSLSDMGVRLALDDFGTGYSSLAYLRRYPFDVIKIDRSFAAGLGKDPDDEAIVASVVAMAGALGRTLIVEGIETASQQAHAQRLGCQFAQGYHYGRPQNAAGLSRALLTDHHLHQERA